MLCLQECRAKPIRVSRYAYNAVLSCGTHCGMLYAILSLHCHTMPIVPYYAYYMLYHKQNHNYLPIQDKTNPLRKPALQFIDWSRGDVAFCTF